MSEFKFLCPECGQKILGDTAYSGAQVACPTCQKNITISAAASVPMIKPPLAEVATGGVPPAAASQQQQTPDRFSALAAASLICSVFVPLGSIPGIICGHLAKARMRRNIFLAGEKMAGAGLLISYCVLMATMALAGVFLLEQWHFKPVMVMRESPEAIVALQQRTVDEIIIGENEDDHDMIGQMYSSTTAKGKTFRTATRGGSFGYTMKVLPNEAMTLNCRYSGDESAGHVFDIAVDDQIIATQDLKAVAPGHYFDMEYKIPRSLTTGKDEVKVEFQAHVRMAAGGLYGCQMLRP
jgi:Domain of unknown function (DUF4190)